MQHSPTSTGAGLPADDRGVVRQTGEGANHCGCSCVSVWSDLPDWRQTLKPK